MLCPSCHSQNCRRSKRRGMPDFLGTLAGLRPWRCRTCEKRFYAWDVPAAYAMYAHCPACGNFEVERIGGEHVRGRFSTVMRLLGFPAYRCDPCRQRFFSVRPHHPIVPRSSTPKAEESTNPS